METDTYVFFFGHTANDLNLQYFSQWYPINFTERYTDNTQIVFHNMEQYMMYHKALLFNDMESANKILNTTNPAIIKKLGRQVKNFNGNIWNNHKFKIVVRGNNLKFKQNAICKNRLLATCDKTIAEASPYDRVWGVGLTASQAIAIPESEWPGKNLLGLALMKVRAIIVKKIEK